MSSRFQSLREEAFAANRALSQSGLVALTFGNVSVADRKSAVFAIKPSGVDYSKLKPEDMVVLDWAGKVVEGSLRPSSDTPTHRLLLRHFDGAASVVHTHSPKAVAFAQAGRVLECLGTTHADYFNGPVPVTRSLLPAEIEGEYELHTGELILEAFEAKDPAATPSVLVRGHGPFAWGPSWEKAIEHAVALELCAAMALDTLLLEPGVRPLCPYLHTKHHSRKHGPSAYYGQEAFIPSSQRSQEAAGSTHP